MNRNRHQTPGLRVAGRTSGGTFGVGRPRLLSLALVMLSPFVACGSEVTDFSSPGESVFPKHASWSVVQGTALPEGADVVLTATPGKTLVASTGIPVQPLKEYFFSAQVSSDDRVVFFLGGLSMSYHRQGALQTVCGLVRSNDASRLELRIQLRSLGDGGGQKAIARVKNLVLREVGRPTSVTPRHASGSTTLVADNRATATVVYPSGTQAGEDQARKVVDAILQKTGVQLSMVSDAEATEEGGPVLRSEYSGQNLILIGRLGTNRAIWPSYNRFLSAEDGYFPGGDGTSLRTAANVFGTGTNHFIVGGSSESGVSRAVGVFCEWMRKQDGSGEKFSLPWTVQTQLGGACLAAVEADEAMWTLPDHPNLYPLTPGYGTIIRWYQNVMGYFWTGRAGYRERIAHYTKQVLKDKAYTHHYIAEFFVRCLGMIDESGTIPPESLEQLDGLALQNFLDFATTLDLTWMTVFSPPYREIELVNRHQIAPWCADLAMARYLQQNLVLGGSLAELIAFRLSEKDALLGSFVAERNGPSMPGIAAASDFEELPAALFRHALEREAYREFFDSGLAHQALHLPRLNHHSGRYAFPSCEVDLPMWLGALAHLTGNGAYRTLAESIPYARHPRGPFQGRYVAGIHRYQTGNDVPPAAPDPAWKGTQILPQPHIADQSSQTSFRDFPVATIRSGFTPEDDFLTVAGVNPEFPSGTLCALSLGGLEVIRNGNGTPGSTESRSTTAGANVLRLSGYQPTGEVQDSSKFCPLRWMAGQGELQGFGFTLDLSAEIQWQRDILRAGSTGFLFADTFTARRAGKYALSVNWPLAAKAVEAGDHWRITGKVGEATIEISGDGFSEHHGERFLAMRGAFDLKEGESKTVFALIARGDAPTPNLRTSGAVASIQTGELKLLEMAVGTGDFGVVVRSPTDVAVLGTPDPARGNVLASTTRSGSLVDRALPLLDVARIPPAETQTPASYRVAPVIPDEQALWETSWTYAGFLKPKRLLPERAQDSEVVFQPPVSLAEIRSTPPLRPWVVSRLPEDLKAFGPNGEAIDLVGTRTFRPSVRTGNYGEAHPVDDADESLFLTRTDKVARLTGVKVGTLQFFDRDSSAARHPIALNFVETSAQGPLLFASTREFPQYPRAWRDDDASFAVLNPADGKPLLAKDVPGPVQALQLFEAKTGQPEVFALKADGRLDAFGLTGGNTRRIDHHAQAVAFDRTYNTGSTRIPAGGHLMPFSMGFWRRSGESQQSRIAIGRYGSAAFLDESGNLEGVLSMPSYAFSATLAEGRDFDGDGVEEILFLERGRLAHVSGTNEPRQIENSGRNPWPQVYDLVAATTPNGATTASLAGQPVHVFEVLEKWGPRPEHVAICRSNFLGLYDAKNRTWPFSWRPPAPVSTAAVIRQSENQCTFLLATVDGFLWTVTLDRRRLERPFFQVSPVSFICLEIRGSSDQDGTALLATDNGLLLRADDSSLRLLRPGAWQSAIFTTSPESIVAADTIGRLHSIRRKPLSEISHVSTR